MWIYRQKKRNTYTQRLELIDFLDIGYNDVLGEYTQYAIFLSQAISYSLVLLFIAITFVAVRPFRLTLFNVVAALGYFTLTGDAVFGAIITQFNPTQIIN